MHTECMPADTPIVQLNPCAFPAPGNAAPTSGRLPPAVSAVPPPSTYTCTGTGAVGASGSIAQPATVTVDPDADSTSQFPTGSVTRTPTDRQPSGVCSAPLSTSIAYTHTVCTPGETVHDCENPCPLP